MRKTLAQYWPLLAVLPIALVLDLVLLLLGEPWSASEWASNIIFAYAVTIATVALARRQERVQEALAATEIVEKIGALSGSLDALRSTGQAGLMRRLLIDGRAGLQLLEFAGDGTKSEYMASLRRATAEVVEFLNGSVRPYTLWSDDDWTSVAECGSSLLDSIDERIALPGSAVADREAARADLRFIGSASAADGVVPITNFERSFRRGDVSHRIRSRLDWDLLRHYVDAGQARVQVVRAWSGDWLGENEVISVWYARIDHTAPDFASATWRDSDVEPIRMSQVRDYFHAMPDARRAGIESMGRSLSIRPEGGLPVIEVVTIQLAAGRLLVIDGNHRVAAVARPERAPLPVTVIEYRIVAPQDGDLLPDLKYFYPAP